MFCSVELGQVLLGPVLLSSVKKQKENGMSEKIPIEELRDSFSSAMKVINEALEGRPVNEERLKVAKFTVQTYKSMQQAENNKKAQDRENKRFNHKLFEMYGDKEQKDELRNLFSEQFKKLKFIGD